MSIEAVERVEDALPTQRSQDLICNFGKGATEVANCAAVCDSDHADNECVDIIEISDVVNGTAKNTPKQCAEETTEIVVKEEGETLTNGVNGTGEDILKNECAEDTGEILKIEDVKMAGEDSENEYVGENGKILENESQHINEGTKQTVEDSETDLVEEDGEIFDEKSNLQQRISVSTATSNEKPDEDLSNKSNPVDHESKAATTSSEFSSNEINDINEDIASSSFTVPGEPSAFSNDNAGSETCQGGSAVSPEEFPCPELKPGNFSEEKAEADEGHPRSSQDPPILTDKPRCEKGLLGPGPTVREKESNSLLPHSLSKKTFYLIKIPKPVDNKLKSRIRLTELQLNDTTARRDCIQAALRLKKASRAEVLHNLRNAREEERICREALRDKRQEMEPVQEALNNLRSASSGARERKGLYSCEEELNERISYLEYRIQHESIPSLKEEKQILREINQLKASREQVCANAVLNAELQDFLSQKDGLQNDMKVLSQGWDSLKKKHQHAMAKVKDVEMEYKLADDTVKQLQAEWEAASQTRQHTYESLKSLQKEENEQNNAFYQCWRVIKSAKLLALKKDKKALEELCNSQVEQIMVQWNNFEGFRAEYIRNNERSTLRRLETLDGRCLSPDEVPPVPSNDLEILIDSAPDTHNILSKREMHDQNEKVIDTLQETSNASATSNSLCKEVNVKNDAEKISIDGRNNGVERTMASYNSTTEVPYLHLESSAEVQKSSAEVNNKMQELEAAESREKCRQAEIAKAKDAKERKNRLAERKRIKAEARAMKEAERREKERQKKILKKTAAVSLKMGTSTELETFASDEARKEYVHQEEEIALAPVIPKAMGNSRPSSQKRRKGSMQSVEPPPKQSVIAIVSKKKGRKSQVWLWFVISVITIFCFWLVAISYELL
eukprot:c16915_g1_i1 orf=602-3316(-)